MFKIEKVKGKFSVELYSVYNKLLWSVKGFSSKQAAFKNIRATMTVLEVKHVLVQDNSILNPVIVKVTMDTITETTLKLWK